MLYFSKLRIFFISLISIFFILIASSNLFNSEYFPFKKKINLGLDLQGGSYLLLEIDNSPVIEQKLQNLKISLRNYFKEKKIRLNNLKISNQSLSFTVSQEFKEIVLNEFNDEESNINPYYQRFKMHQYDVTEKDNQLVLKFSRQGLVELKTSSQDQALELSLIHI